MSKMETDLMKKERQKNRIVLAMQL